MTRLTRRGVMGGLAVLPVPIGSTTVNAVANPDAMLLKACAEALWLGNETDRLCEVQCDANDAGDKDAEDAAYNAALVLVPDYLAAVELVAELPTAATVEGRRARAQVALHRVQRSADGTPHNLEDRVLASLCADVLHMQAPA